MKNKFIPLGILVLFSIFIGIFFYFIPSLWAFLFCFFCFLLVFRYLNTTHAPRVVYIMVISAILIRVILAFMNDLVSYYFNIFDLIGDADNYTLSGVYIAEVLTDNAIRGMPTYLWGVYHGALPHPNIYQVTGLAYLQGIIFSAYGYSALGIKVFNSTLGVLIGVVVYCFLRRRIGVHSSTIALFLILFYPSLIIWSSTGLKDLLVIFITLLFLIAIGKMINGEVRLKGIIIMIPILGLFMMVIYTLRPFLLFLYITVIVFSLFIIFFLRLSGFKKAVILLGIFICIFLLNQKGFFRESINRFFSNTINLQRGFFYHGGARTAYKIYPDRFYTDEPVSSILKEHPLTISEAVLTLTKSSVNFMFSPLPMHLKLSKFLVLVYPQSLFTLLLFPFMLIGTIRILRFQPVPFIPFLLFMVGYVFLSSLISGNIGTAFRHKDTIIPIYMIFSVIGINLIFRIDKVMNGKSSNSQEILQ